MANIFEESFHILVVIMRAVKIYSKSERSTSRRIFTFFTFLITCTHVMLGFPRLFAGDSDFQEMTSLLIFVIIGSATMLRLVPFLIDPGRIKNIVGFLDADISGARNEDQKRILLDGVNTCRLICNVYFGTSVISLGCWTILPLFLKEKRLPVNVWLPFETTNPVVFYATYFYIAGCTLYQAVPAFCLDPLVAGLAYHARGQFRILTNMLRQLDNFEDEKINFEQAADILKDCVQHHDNLLKFIKEIESCFSWSITVNISGAIIGMCYSSIGLTMVPIFSAEAMTFSQTYLTLAGQILFYCYFGSILFEENEQLITSIYMCEWYRYDARIRRVLVIMMERAKVPVDLSAGKIIRLNLATFTSAIKSSYSLIAVLNRQ